MQSGKEREDFTAAARCPLYEQRRVCYNWEKKSKVGGSAMKYTAAILTVSDRCSRGVREDVTGPALKRILEEDGWEIINMDIVPDEFEVIKGKLVHCSYDLDACLILTAGGTGFSRRDVTPEATEAVINRVAPGISEAMRAAALAGSRSAMLSRGIAGLRGGTLIINMPGSMEPACASLRAILPALKPGIDRLRREEVDWSSRNGE